MTKESFYNAGQILRKINDVEDTLVYVNSKSTSVCFYGCDMPNKTIDLANEPQLQDILKKYFQQKLEQLKNDFSEL